jgi:hypothetical protein
MIFLAHFITRLVSFFGDFSIVHEKNLALCCIFPQLQCVWSNNSKILNALNLDCFRHCFPDNFLGRRSPTVGCGVWFFYFYQVQS